MNGLENIQYTNNPKVYAELAENVEDKIRKILEYHINESNIEKEGKA